MRKLAIIGSTGSIGTQALDVIKTHPESFCVAALTGHSNIDLLKRQADIFSPKVIGLSDESLYEQAKVVFKDYQLICGPDAHAIALEDSGADGALIAVVGFAGLKPLIKSIELRLHTCVANKESIVCGGEAITALAKKHGVTLYPVDSEHSAIFQCLQNQNRPVRRILLTCSGGPFRTWERAAIKKATVTQALKHPNWDMGGKITIDSATLANKGLEVLEAKWLFDVPVEGIEVIVHPQSIVHSMVEFMDHSILAQLGWPDMRLPIQYALSYPETLEGVERPLDFFAISDLTFEQPDSNRFPCLALAYEAGRRGGEAPIAFNAANDIAVQRYQKGLLGFYDIPRLIEKAMDHFTDGGAVDLDAVFAIDQAVRAYTEGIC